MHITNINHALKTIKSNMIANFICVEDKGIIITSPRLPQSKSYLKIIGIPFINKKTNSYISSDDIKNILKNNHLFNDIILTSKP